jgi:hypothetical protein
MFTSVAIVELQNSGCAQQLDATTTFDNGEAAPQGCGAELIFTLPDGLRIMVTGSVHEGALGMVLWALGQIMAPPPGSAAEPTSCASHLPMLAKVAAR